MKKSERKELGLEFKVSRRALQESDKLKQCKDYFKKKTRQDVPQKLNKMNQTKATNFSGHQ